MNIENLVITHKKNNINLPQGYYNLLVGANKNDFENCKYLKDNTGINISDKNSNYCELTGLYWAWKNLECDYIGINHYRRYFSGISNIKKIFYELRNKKLSLSNLLKIKEIKNIIREYDIIVPKKVKFHEDTIESNYNNCHFIKDLELCGDILIELYPDYKNSFTTVMNSDQLSCYNMFILSKENYNSYCEWLFSILFELEKKIDISEYDAYQSRIYGFLSERLLNVWINKKEFKVKYINTFNTELPKQHQLWRSLIPSNFFIFLKKNYKKVVK